MNKIYKVIWSRVKHCYVVVSEIAKREGKSTNTTGLARHRAAILAVATLCLVGGGALQIVEAAGTDRWMVYYDPDALEEDMRNNNKQWGNDNDQRPNNMDYGTFGLKSSYGRIDKRFGLITGVDTFGRQIDDGLKFRTSLGAKFYNLGFGASTFGYGSTADGSKATALGYGSYAKGADALAVGGLAKVTADQGVAIGANTIAGNQATAVGTDSKATGYASIAIGSDDGQPDAMKGGEFADRYPVETINKIFADLRKTKSDAELFDSKYALTPGVVDRRVWSPNYAHGQVSIAIGARAVGYGNASTAVGALAFALGEHSTAIGVRSYVSYHAPGGMALGELSRVMAKNGLAVGNLSYSDRQGSVAYGYDAKAVGDNSIAIGHSVGANVELTQDSKNVLEKVLTYRVVTNPTKVSGTSLETTEDRLSYLDKLKEEWADDNQRQIGEVVGADLKRKVEYAKKQSTVMVNGKKENATNAIAIGRRAYAEGDNSMVMGSLSLGLGTNSLGIGHMTYTSGDNSTAIGMEAIATAKNSMAIGVKSYANLENSIAIGVNSRTDYTQEDLEKDGWVPRGAISFPSSTQVGIVSVGSVGQERRIANVAAGYRDTDAVNVSQLRSIEDRFTNNLPDDDVANPFAYTSIEKNKGDAKDVLPLQKKDIDYRKYVHYRTKQLEIMLKERGGERIDKDFKERINKAVKEIADKGDNAYGIQSTKLGGIGDVDDLLNVLKEKDSNLDKNNIEQALTVLSAYKKELLKDTLKKSLSPDDLKKLGATNYLNDGAQGKDAIAIGYKALALGDDGIAIGKNSHVPQNIKGGIALGTDALADRDKGQFAYDPKTNRAFANDGEAKQAEGGLRAMKSSGAALSIGNGKVARQIINVAGGTEDTDAVNVAQLKRLGASVDTKVDTKLNDVLNKGLKFHFDPEWGGTPTVGVKQDDSARILIKGKSEGYNSDPRSEFAEGNIGVFGHDFDIDKKKGTKEKGLILTLKKNMTGLESIELSKDGNTVRLGSSGINMGGQKITGMAEGALNANSTDAVTGKQLYAVKTQSENLETTVNTQLGLNITADGGGDPWVGVGTKTNQRGIIAFGVQGGESDTSKLTTKEDKNIGVIVSREKNNDPHQNDDKIITQVRLAKNLTNLESIGLKKNIDGKDYTVQLKGNGIDMGQNKITNMADATLSATSNDAVTGKQLYELQQTVDGKADTGLTNITNGAKDVITGLTNVVGTGAVTVTPTTDNNTRTKTFTVNVAKDGQIADNNTGLVTGGTVKAALDSVGFNIAGDTGSQPKIAVTPSPKGVQLNIKGNTAKDAELSEGNIGVVAASAKDGNPPTLNVKLAKKLANLEEIKLSKDNKTVTLSNTGITMGDQKITGMADGALSATSTDAVTGKQLYGLQENATDINVTNWTTTLGTGTIGGKNDSNLVTGATVKAALDNKVDTTTYTTGMAGKADTALSNITADGKDVITGLVDVKGEGGATVESATNETSHKKTFTVKVAKDGVIAKDNTGLVTGGTVKAALDQKVDTTTYTTGMAGKADTKLSNIDDDGKTVIKNLAKEQIDTTVDETYVTGKVKKGALTSTTLDIQGDGKLVGDNLTINIKDQSITKAKLDTALSSELDGKMASWVLKASSDTDEAQKAGQTIDNTTKDVIFDVATDATSKGLTVTRDGNKITYGINKADLAKAIEGDIITNINSNSSPIDNISAKFSISDVTATNTHTQAVSLTKTSQPTIQFLGEKDKIDVTVGTDGTNPTVTVTANTNLGKNLDISNNKSVKDINTAITNITKADGALSNKADKDATNIDATAKAKWIDKLGGGTIDDKATNANLVTGATVKAALDKKVDTTTYNTGMATKVDTATYTTDMAGKADTALSNITGDGKDVITGLVDVTGAGGATVTSATDKDSHIKTFTVTVAKDGKIADKDTGIVTGETVYNYVHPIAEQVTQNAGDITTLKTNVTNLNNNLTAGFNLKVGEDSSAVVLNAKAAPTVEFAVEKADAGLTVSKAGNKITYGIDGSKIDLTGNTSITNINSRIDDITAQSGGDLSKKADKDAKNIDDAAKANWIAKLGGGTIDDKATNANLVTGATVKTALDGKMASWVLKASSDASEEAKKGQTIDNTNNDVIFDVATADASKGLTVTRAGNKITYGINKAELAKAIEGDIISNINSNSTPIENISANFSISDKDNTNTKNISLTKTSHPTIQFLGEKDKIDVTVGGDAAAPTVTVTANAKLGENLDISNNKSVKDINTAITNITKADGALSNKADKNATNIDDKAKASWIAKLGDGTIDDKATNANLVTGATVKAALDKKVDTTTYNTGMATKVDTATYTTDMAGKADTALSNITGDGKDVITGLVDVTGAGGATVTSATDKDSHIKTFTVTVAKDGKIADKDTGIVTGETVYNYVHPIAEQVTQNAGDITTLKTNVTNLNNNLTAGFNLKVGEDSSAVVLNAKAAPTVEFAVEKADAGLTVSKAGNKITYGIDGSKIDLAGNTSITNINSRIDDITAQSGGDLSKKADKDAKNIDDAAKASWITKLGGGTIDDKATNANLVTGATVKTALDGKMASWVLKASSDANAKDEETKKGQTIDNTNNDVIFDVATEDASKGLTVTRAGNKITYGINKAELAKAIEGDIISNINSNSTPIENISANFSISDKDNTNTKNISLTKTSHPTIQFLGEKDKIDVTVGGDAAAPTVTVTANAKLGENLDISNNKSIKDINTEITNITKNGLSIPGKDGKSIAGLNGNDGIGHLGLTGAKGDDGKSPSIDMTAIKGKAGVDGKDGITRLQYVDENNNPHQVATLEDGLKFTGNNSAVNKHQLNSTVKIVGQGLVSADDATYNGKDTDTAKDKAKKAFLSDKTTQFEGTDDNIGVISDGTDTLTVSLSKNVKNLDSIGSKKVVIGDPDKGGKGKGKVTTLSTDDEGKLVLQKGTAENATKEAILTATRENVDNGDGTTTPTDIIKLGEGPDKQAGTDGVNGTIGVNGKDGTSKVGIDGQKGVTVTGTNGKDGKDGKNGTVGINGTDGITVTGHTNGEAGNNGKDGTIGINGTDGISMTGDAAQNGVSIKGEDGKTQVAGLNGKDGIGHLELSGKDGTPSIDMTAITGDTDVDGDSTKEADKITRLNYKDKAGKNHQVATLTDGMKYAGDNAKDDGTNVLKKKLNNQVDIVGDIGNAKEADFISGNIGVFANTADGKLHVKLAKDIKANTLTLEDSDTPQDPATKKPITLTNKKGGLYIGAPEENDANKVVTKSELSNSSQAGQNALQTIQVKAGKTDVKTLKKPTATDTAANVLEFEAGENVQIDNDNGKVKISATRDQSADTITVGVAGENGKDGHIGVNGKNGKDGVGIDGKDGITIIGHEDPVKPEAGQPGKPGRDGTIGINGLDGISMTGEAGKNGLSIKGKDGTSIAGLNGKDGIGHLGLTGAKGDDGKTPSIDMTAIKGDAGVNGKDGITRLQYKDENDTPHQVATLDDGLKFIGNNSAVNAHKLNTTVKIVGQGLVSADDATYNGKDTDTAKDKAKKAFLSDKTTQFEGTNDNIGVISDGGDTLTVSLSKNVKNLDSIGSKKVVIGDPDKGNVTTLSTDDKGRLVLQKGTDETAPKEAILTATREEVDNGDGTKTPTDIIKLGEGPTTPNGTDGVNGTIGVNGKDGTSKVGIDGQKGVTVTGTNGKDGKDGKNGTVGINGTDGITVTGHTNGEAGKKGKDGTIGINGTDGISMTGDAAKNGVSIKGEDGKTQVAGLNGKDGIGHLELSGKGGTPSIDMIAITGDTDVDGDPTKEADKITRLNYKDKAGKDHQVATLTDGMKYAGDNAKTDGTNVLKKKLNNQVDIVGDIGDNKTVDDFISGNIGVFANADGKLHVKLAKDIKANTLTLEDSDTPQDPDKKTPITLTNKKGGLYIGAPEANDANKVVTQSELSTSSQAGQNALQTIQVKAGGTDVKTLKKPTDTDTAANVLEFEAGENVQIDNDNGKVKISATRDQSADTITVGEKGEAGKPGKDGKIGVNGKDGKSGVGIDGKDGITLKGEAGEKGLSIKGEPGKPGDPAPTIAGLNGKDGIGHLGLTGDKGEDGKTPSIDMTAIKGKAGVDGKDGITRLQYVDENKTAHEVATLDDGLKFIGNNLAVNAHKLNSTVKIVGQGLVSADDATYDGKGTDTDIDKNQKTFLSDKKTKFEGTDDNIGVISNGTDTLTVSLSKNVKNLDSIGSKKVVIGDPDKGGKGKGKVTTLSTDDEGKLVLQKGTAENAPKEAILTATREEVDNGDGTKTPTDIIKLGEGPTTPNGTDGVNGTIGVNGKDGTSKVGIDGQKGVTVTGTNGKDGKDGKNGTVGINGADGITVTGHTNGEAGKKGKDGTIGINGTDGISMTGDAAKNGVSIKGEDGKTQVAGLNGKDGIGHLELSGKGGTPSIDMTAITGDTDVDGDPTKEADKITRLNYKDKAGKDHQVATLTDGMKYAGDNAKADGTNVLKKKLNNQVDIVGDIGDTKTEADFIPGNIGVFANADGKLHVKLAKDITGLDSVTTGIVNATNEIVVGDPDKGGKGQGKVATLTTSDDGKLMLQNAGVATPREVLTVTETNNTTTIILGEAGKNGQDGKNGHIGVNGKDGKPGVGIDGKDGITLEGEAGKNGVSIKGEPGKNGEPAPTIAGLNGKDGIGHLGLTGAKGDDGKSPSIDMTVITGDTDVNGDPTKATDKITRLNYVDPEQKDEHGLPINHQVATLTDGLKFIGNNLAVNKHQLNSTVKIVGQGLVSADDATYDGKGTDTDIDKNQKTFLSDKKTKFEGTDDNIGVISNGTDTLTVSLSKNVKNLDSIGSKKVVIGDPDKGGKGKGKVTTLSTDDEGKLVLQKGTAENAPKEAILTATREEVDNGDGTKTPTDIIKLGEGPTTPNGTDGVNGTIGVNGKDGTSKVDIDGQKGVTVTGKNGKDGKDGKNGTVGINGTDGITVTGHTNGEDGNNGKDGTIGINGTDGISMTGEAGKNGVSIKGEDGKTQVAGLNGKDGVGHLELAGKDGTPSIDMTAITGNTDVDGDSTKEADKITRLNYKDKAGKNHQVATLDDGMKYSGDNAKADGTNVLKKKLNNQVDIVGDIKDKDVNHFISGNIGVFAYDGKLHVKLAKDITGLDSVTSGIVNATNKIVVGDPDKNGKGQGKVATLTTSDDGKLMLQNAGVDTPREVLTVTEKNNTTTIILGEAGENGKDGKNGHIGVNGKDGKPGVGIDGKDGITLEGEAGKNGLSIKGEPGKPGDPAPTIAGLNGKGGIGHLGLTGAKGADGKTPSMDMTVIAGNTDVNGNPDTDKMTRLNYKDEAGKEHQVATLTDGLKFAGNNKTVSKQTLNSTVQIVGQGLQAGDADGEAKLSDGKTKFVGTNDNIGVISDGKGKLTVALHEDVKVKTVTATDGITVGKGEGAVALKGKDGKLVLEVKDKDGKTTETKEVLTTGSSNITVGSKAEKPHDGKPGTDGQDGTIGVNGKNGSTVVLNGKDGSIGLNGENGKDGISIRGKAGENIPGQAGKDGINGKTGIDGTDVTRIVYTEKNPDDSDKKDTNGKPITHQVANLDDGMKYAGDNAGENGANVLAKKLNNQVDIVGDIAKDKTENDFTKGNIGVFANATDGKLHVKLAKTVDGLDKVSTKKVVIGDPDKNVTTLSTDDTGRLVLQKGTKEDAPKETILTATQVTDPSGKVVGDELHLGSGKDGINGKITADGKDGKSKVGIDGTDGITITGHTDAKDGQPAKDGTIGINGTNGITMTGDAAKGGIQIENGPVLNAEGLDMKDKGIKGLGSISAKTINATDDKGNTTVSMNGKNGTLSFAGTTGADGKAIPGVTLGTNNGRLVVLDDNNKPKDTVALVSDLQDIVNKTDTAIMKIDRNVRNVGANAAAMAMLKPLQYDPLEPTQIMAAIGSYRGTQAAAIGLSHYTNESTMFNVGVSVGAGNNMMGVGVTRKFGSSADERAVPDRYKAGPISSVYVMQDEVTALKAENRQIKASYYKVLQDNEEMKAKLDALMKKLGL